MTDIDRSLPRCGWASAAGRASDIELLYHDREWGVPLHDEQKLFEFLLLEGAQAGLSWRTVLHKREGYREAFANFDAERIARFGKREVEMLLKNPAIIRNRLKIEATIFNARAYLKMLESGETLEGFFWDFVDGEPTQNRWKTMSEMPAETPLSRTLSKALKERGFRFVGPTICYAHMQATGMVNDHIVSCFRHDEVAQLTTSPV